MAGRRGASRTPGVRRIDAGRRLVEQDHLRTVDEGADQRELLLHATRKVLCTPVTEGRQARHLKELGLSLAPRGPGNAEHLGEEGNVFGDGQFAIHAEALREVTEARAHALRGRARYHARRRGGCPHRAGRAPPGVRIIVVLPAPSGPTRPKISPRGWRATPRPRRPRRRSACARPRPGLPAQRPLPAPWPSKSAVGR